MDRQTRLMVTLWTLVAAAAVVAVWVWMWKERSTAAVTSRASSAAASTPDQFRHKPPAPAAGIKRYHITVNVGTPSEVRYETRGYPKQVGTSNVWEIVEWSTGRKITVSGNVIIVESPVTN